VRLATFNILHGRSLTDDRVDLDRFAGAVRALDADVLALQEVDRDQSRSHGADLTAVAADAMGAPEHRFAATLHGAPGLWLAATGDREPTGAAYGIALLSRHPVLTWRVLALPRLRGPRFVRWGGKGWPRPVRDEPRTALAAVVATPEGELTVVATHLTFLAQRNALQLRHLVAAVADLPRPLVLAGDLNLRDARPAAISGLRSLGQAPTYPVEAPRFQLDHLLADGPVEADGSARALDLGISDHRALVVDVRLG